MDVGQPMNLQVAVDPPWPADGHDVEVGEHQGAGRDPCAYSLCRVLIRLTWVQIQQPHRVFGEMLEAPADRRAGRSGRTACQTHSMMTLPTG